MKIRELFEASETETSEIPLGLNFDGPQGRSDLALARVFRAALLSKKYREELEEWQGPNFAQQLGPDRLKKSFMLDCISYLENTARLLAKGSITRDAAMLSNIKDKNELDLIRQSMREKFEKFHASGIMEGRQSCA